MSADTLLLRTPTTADGAALHALIRACKPLDENSLYCNLLQCTHFAATCCVALRGERMLGFVSGYRLPEHPEVYFLWQVGVHADAAGQGLAKRMIQHILARPSCAGVSTLHTTITLDNAPSRQLFASLAKAEGAELREQDFFRPEHFGDSGHAAEYLFEIGPLSSPPAA